MANHSPKSSKSTATPRLNINHQAITDLLKEHVDTLSKHSQRTRYIVAAIGLFTILIGINTINLHFGYNKARINARHWNINKDAIDKHIQAIEKEKKGSKNQEKNTKTINRINYIKKQITDRDSKEINHLRRAEFVNLEVVNIPGVGASISAADANFIFAMSLSILFYWLLLGIQLESKTLNQIMESEKEPKYDDWQIEAIRPIIRDQFLFIDSADNNNSRAKNILRIPILFILTSWFVNFYDNFVKTFPDTGKTFAGELLQNGTEPHVKISKICTSEEYKTDAECALKIYLKLISNDFLANFWSLCVKTFLAFTLIVLIYIIYGEIKKEIDNISKSLKSSI